MNLEEFKDSDHPPEMGMDVALAISVGTLGLFDPYLFLRKTMSLIDAASITQGLEQMGPVGQYMATEISRELVETGVPIGPGVVPGLSKTRVGQLVEFQEALGYPVITQTELKPLDGFSYTSIDVKTEERETAVVLSNRGLDPDTFYTIALHELGHVERHHKGLTPDAYNGKHPVLKEAEAWEWAFKQEIGPIGRVTREINQWSYETYLNAKHPSMKGWEKFPIVQAIRDEFLVRVITAA